MLLAQTETVEPSVFPKTKLLCFERIISELNNQVSGDPGPKTGNFGKTIGLTLLFAILEEGKSEETSISAQILSQTIS